MDILCEKLQPYLPLDRVKDVDLIREHVECCLCHGLLWYPVACKNCEKAFCSACIQALHAGKSEQICPNGCSSYIERKDLPTIIRIFTNLKITCRYKSNGCTEILLYYTLEKHENICDYQLLTCTGCEQEIIKKDFDQHKSQCLLLLITCDQCSTSYKRKDKDLHTLTECLRIQLQQQKSKIELMEQKFKEYDKLWAAFFGTTKEIRGMLNGQAEPIKTPDHNGDLSM